MAFSFRFKSLLKHRERQLEEAQGAMAKAQQRQREIQNKIDKLRAQSEAQGRQLEERQKSGIDAASYFFGKHYLSMLEQQILMLEKELERAKVEVGRRKLVVIEKDRAVKRLEVLEEQDREEYRRFQLLREQKLLDEVAIIRDSRDRLEPGRE